MHYVSKLSVVTFPENCTRREMTGSSKWSINWSDRPMCQLLFCLEPGRVSAHTSGNTKAGIFY
jgi:hypothetical protein